MLTREKYLPLIYCCTRSLVRLMGKGMPVRMRLFSMICCMAFLAVAPVAVSGQALIALVFGKKITTQRLHMGIYLGASGSWLQHATGQQPRIALAVGAYTAYDLDKHWQLELDIIMRSPRGANQLRYENAFAAPEDTLMRGVAFDRKLTYITFSPLLRWRLSPSFGIAAGPQLAVRTVAKDIFKREMERGTLSYNYDSRDDIHRFDAGAVFDLQYVLMKGKGIRLNLQFGLGISNPYKPEGREGRSRQLLLGAGIPIGSK